MANSIELAKIYRPILDEIYKFESVTEGMDTGVQPDFTNTPEIKYLQVSSSGLGKYDRNTGYPKGSVNAVWKTFTMTQERGQTLNVDRMDDEETLNMTFGAVMGEFMRTQVVPEIDAYRFAKYAGTPGIQQPSTPVALTSANILAAINEAVRALDAAEVTREGRIIFLNSDLQPALWEALNRTWSNETGVNTQVYVYNNMAIVLVPPTRFNTSITMNTGAGDVWGYTPDGDNIQFMLVQPNAVVQVQKLLLPKIFDPDENQEMDSWKFQFRLYHDAFVYENKVKGIYTYPNA